MFEVLMDEFTNILDEENKWQYNCCLGLKLQTLQTHTGPIIYNEVVWEKKKEMRKLKKKKLISCQHTDFSACLIEKGVISFISFEDREEAIIVQNPLCLWEESWK